MEIEVKTQGQDKTTENTQKTWINSYEEISGKKFSMDFVVV